MLQLLDQDFGVLPDLGCLGENLGPVDGADGRAGLKSLLFYYVGARLIAQEGQQRTRRRERGWGRRSRRIGRDAILAAGFLAMLSDQLLRQATVGCAPRDDPAGALYCLAPPLGC